MRLHQLQITAFGPFAETVDVDFDHLSKAGLFLLSGPTGSGKTSVLDAVTFALYGAVPGDRNTAKRLRSDHAAAHVSPEVTLEATLAGRRFRITRSPSWDRPKKRGSGLTAQPPSVSLSECTDGRWQHLSSRADETGQIIGDLLGMNLTQFTQVALLPQGRFQLFLRATSEERHHLLQRLFRTGRFESVEAWLRDHRLHLKGETTQAHHQLAEVISRISEAVDQPLPEDWDVGDLSSPATDGTLVTWLHTHHRDVGSRLLSAREEHAIASEAEGRAAELAQQAQQTAERRERLSAAVTERDQLQQRAVDQLYRKEQLTLARRASGIADALALTDEARLRSARAEQQLDGSVRTAWETGAAFSSLVLGNGCTSNLERDPDQLTLDWDDADAAPAHQITELSNLMEMEPEDLTGVLQASVTRAVGRAAQLRLLEPRSVRREEIRDLMPRISHQCAVASEARDALEERAAAVGRHLVDEQGTLLVAQENSRRLPELATQLEESHRRLTAHADVEHLSGRIQTAREDHRLAQQRAQDQREVWLHLKETRLESMAAEIAGQLVVGGCCPVCGSAEHPAKAQREALAPDAEQEKAAFTAMEDAKSEAHARDMAARDLATQLALAGQRAGSEPESEARAKHAALEQAVSEAAQSQELVARLQESSTSLSATQLEIRNALASRSVEITELEASRRALSTEAETIDSELTEALGGSPAHSLRDLMTTTEARTAAARHALEACQSASALRTGLQESVDRLQRSLARAGFDHAEDAKSALLADDTIAELEATVHQHDTALAAVQRALAEPGVKDALAQPPPDLDALRVELARLRAEAATRHELVVLLSSRVERLRDLADALAVAHATWQPLHEQWLLASSLSAFVEGKAPDNQWHMRLSAYVLAYRLNQVVQAANERLAGMSDQRYALVHTGQRGAGEKRGGLSLLIRDDWSGETRDPATLSGGETFVVSLALALGLSDVITDEAGGASLDTLFVDEGFGSLDAETLDGVMETLDSLRDGGRVVGVVSHVPEMRDRIPTQLLLSKARSGSTLAICG